MLNHLILAFVFVLSPFLAEASQAICLQGQMQVPLDYVGPEFDNAAKLDFRIEIPAGNGVGRFKTVLTNGAAPHRGLTSRGTEMTKVADAITPDDLPMKRSDLSLRCPCEQLWSEGGKVVVEIEHLMADELNVRFVRYFNITMPDVIQVSDVKPCQ